MSVFLNPLLNLMCLLLNELYSTSCLFSPYSQFIFFHPRWLCLLSFSCVIYVLVFFPLFWTFLIIIRGGGFFACLLALQITTSPHKSYHYALVYVCVIIYVYCKVLSALENKLINLSIQTFCLWPALLGLFLISVVNNLCLTKQTSRESETNN